MVKSARYLFTRSSQPTILYKIKTSRKPNNLDITLINEATKPKNIQAEKYVAGMSVFKKRLAKIKLSANELL